MRKLWKGLSFWALLLTGMLFASSLCSAAEIAKASVTATADGDTQIKVSVITIPDANWYQYDLALNSEFSQGLLSKKSQSTSVTFTGLSAGSTYYVHVRAYYKPETGDRIFGDWSSTAMVTTSGTKTPGTETPETQAPTATPSTEAGSSQSGAPYSFAGLKGNWYYFKTSRFVYKLTFYSEEKKGKNVCFEMRYQGSNALEETFRFTCKEGTSTYKVKGTKNNSVYTITMSPQVGDVQVKISSSERVYADAVFKYGGKA